MQQCHIQPLPPDISFWRKGNAKLPVMGLSDRVCLPAVLNHLHLCFCGTYHLHPSSDEGRLWKGPRQMLQRRGNGGVCAGAGRHWPATQPPGLQIRSDMSKCRAQFHNHCSALHQRQPARQHGCVTSFLTHLLFPPSSYCLSVSHISR